MSEPIQTPPGTDNTPLVATPPAPANQPPTPPPAPKPEETVDYWKTKFSESSREAQLLREAETARKKAEQELTKEPTDSELKAAFPEWDALDDFQKRTAREAFEAKRIAATAAKRSEELAAKDSWNTSIELAVSSNPSLQGKEQAFRQFALKPQYRGVPMELLVDSFLQKTGAAAPTPTPPAPAQEPKPGLLPGNGGPRTPDAPKKLSAEELKRIRETDTKRYMELVKSGQAELE